MAEIRWTEEASDCLECIFEYISEHNPNFAHAIVAGIYDKIQILAEFPQIGHLYRIESEGQVRILIYGHYKIGYLFHDNDSIVVLGVVHGSMPVEHWLRRDRE